MAKIAILDLIDQGNDVLLVRGTDGSKEAVRIGTEDDGETPITEERPVVFEATGWVSALTNHFGPEDYLPDGHRKPNAKPRAMTDDERTAYAIGLLAEQNPALSAAPKSLLATKG